MENKSLWDYEHDRPNLPFFKRMMYYAVCYWFEFEENFLAPCEGMVLAHPFVFSFVLGICVSLLALKAVHVR